eukprot:scaffold14516_cov48-Prasinocladus_malaysianus.AAC.1
MALEGFDDAATAGVRVRVLPVAADLAFRAAARHGTPQYSALELGAHGAPHCLHILIFIVKMRIDACEVASKLSVSGSP